MAVKVTAQEKIAELEGRIAQLETQVANLKKHKVGRCEQDPSWFVKMCDVFFNGRPA